MQARKSTQRDAWPQSSLWRLAIIMQGVSLCNRQTETGTRTMMWSGRATPCWCASLPSWVTAWGAEEESVMSFASLPRRYVLLWQSCRQFVPTRVFVQHLQLRRWTREPAVSQSRSEFSLFSELWEISQPFPTLCGNEAAKLKQTSSVLMISPQHGRTPIQRKHTCSTH